MQKIISLFQRNYETDKLVRDEVVPGAEWVLNNEGLPFIKWNGTCCLISEGKLYKRYDAKHGKTPPEGFMPAQIPDEKTGHWPGWLPVKEDDPQDKYHVEAFKRTYCDYKLNDGTYELCGPKINGNKHLFKYHKLIPHRYYRFFPHKNMTYEVIKYLLKLSNEDDYLEGIVWHHPDGRMVKIKHKDFFK